jgi:sec-independent protein translocase protein TatB
MFDIGFTELMIVAVVALVVIGPERLPTVARTLGHLLGRFQRYVGDVKADIQREMQLDELRKIQTDIEKQARSIETSVRTEMSSVESAVSAPLESLQTSIDDVMKDAAQPAVVAIEELAPESGAPRVSGQAQTGNAKAAPADEQQASAQTGKTA